jgi:DNA mismatch repair protein MutS
VKEVGNKILFTRKLVTGGSEHSFGIHVAKMAGMPKKVLDRANQILSQLEGEREGKDSGVGSNQESRIKIQESRNKNPEGFAPAINNKQEAENLQLSFFQLNDPVLENIKEEIKKTDINTLTPIEALMKLNEIKKMIGA